MKAALVIIGDEVLTGRATDDNGVYIGQRLSLMGVEIIYKVTVRDEIKDIKEALKKALAGAELVILTGGLGPTRDDKTREAVSDLLKKKLKFHGRLYENIKSFYRKKNLYISPINIKQAYLPEGSLPLHNTVGTAPGFLIKSKRKLIIVLPGPPRELKPMFENVVPAIKKKLKFKAVFIDKILKTYGIGESLIEEKIRDIKDGKGLSVKFQAHPGQVDIHLCARAGSWTKATKIIGHAEKGIKKKLEGFIFAVGPESMEEIIGGILKKKGLTLSIAESCSGGLVSNLVTNVPGASNYFMGSVVSYSNDVKKKILNVPAMFLRRYGAVSSPVAIKMAEGIRVLIKTDLGLGITGIAGPVFSGGLRKRRPVGETKNKPVGLVYIALSSDKGTAVEKFNFYGERTEIKKRTADAAFAMLWKYLKEVSSMKYQVTSIKVV